MLLYTIKIVTITQFSTYNYSRNKFRFPFYFNTCDMNYKDEIEID